MEGKKLYVIFCNDNPVAVTDERCFAEAVRVILQERVDRAAELMKAHHGVSCFSWYTVHPVPLIERSEQIDELESQLVPLWWMRRSGAGSERR